MWNVLTLAFNMPTTSCLYAIVSRFAALAFLSAGITPEQMVYMWGVLTLPFTLPNC